MVSFDLKTLAANSAAYKAYTNCELLPKAAPSVACRVDDTPILYAGERFCRVLEFGRLCGHKSANLCDLAEHIFKEHGLKQVDYEDLPMECYLGKNDLLRLNAFYRHVMEARDYDGKNKFSEDELKIEDLDTAKKGGK